MAIALVTDAVIDLWPSTLPRGRLRSPQRPGAQARRLLRLSCPKFGHGSAGSSCRRRHKREQRNSQAISVNCLDKALLFYTIPRRFTYESHLRFLQLAGERSSYTWHSTFRLSPTPNLQPTLSAHPTSNIQPTGLCRLFQLFSYLYISGILIFAIL